LFEGEENPKKGITDMRRTIPVITDDWGDKSMDIGHRVKTEPGLGFTGKSRDIDFKLSNYVQPGIKEKLRVKVVRYILEILCKLPQKVSGTLVRLVMERIWRQKIGNVEQILATVKRFSRSTNKICQERILDTLVFKGMIGNQQIRDELRRSGQPPMYTILISPTMRCNLTCNGCYAKNYQKRDDLPSETLDRIVEEGKEIGVAFFTILGGEPFMRNDLFSLFRKHPDVYFQVFTNSTLLNEEMARDLGKMGNVTIQCSIEGFEEVNDNRRGRGHFEKVMNTMDTLSKCRVPFGYSVCVTRNNVEEVMSNQFLEFMIERGAFVGWYFLYMPVCGDTNTDLMPLPEQRKLMKERRDYIRNHYPILIIDFWNDAPYVGGCISAKYYCHINNFGDVEPCIFTHFSQANIKNCSLKEALNCELFKEIRSHQPFDKNLFLPCPLIDNPRASRTFLKNPGVYPTHPRSLTLIEDLNGDLDRYADEIHQLYSPVWEEWEKARESALAQRGNR
jgi:MoaA/NifB/PqqE/SkfB family radical SAM enzyme